MTDVKQWNIIPNMEQYKKHPGLDYHDVVALLRSPDHYVNGVHPERSVIKQDIIDAILNPGEWFANHRWIDGDLRLKANKDRKKEYESNGIIVVKKDYYDMIEGIIKSVVRHEKVSSWLSRDPYGVGLYTEARPTYKSELHIVGDDCGVILKPMLDAREFRERTIENRWDIQSRLAEKVVEENLHKKIPIYFVAIETEKPYAIMIYRILPDAQTDGDIGIAECVYQDKIIPNDITSYPDEIHNIDL